MKPLPIDSIKPPGDEIVRKMQSSLLRVEKLPDNIEARRSLAEYHWRIIAAWFAKLRFLDTTRKKYRMPFPQKHANPWKPFAEVLICEFNICVEIAGSSDSVEYNKEYKNPEQRFQLLIEEHKSIGLKQAYEEPVKRKEEAVSKARERLTLLGFSKSRSGNNPYSPQTEPHTWRLIEDCLILNKRRPKFSEDFWKPYLKAQSKWLTHLSREKFYLLRDEGEKLVYRTGQGSDMRKIEVLESSPEMTRLRSRKYIK